MPNRGTLKRGPFGPDLAVKLARYRDLLIPVLQPQTVRRADVDSQTRRVKCSEDRPVCAMCARLQLRCIYQAPKRRNPREHHSDAKRAPRDSSNPLETAGCRTSLDHSTLLELPGQPSGYDGDANLQTDNWFNFDWNFATQVNRDHATNNPRDPWLEADLLQFQYPPAELSPLWTGYNLHTPSVDRASSNAALSTNAPEAAARPSSSRIMGNTWDSASSTARDRLQAVDGEPSGPSASFRSPAPVGHGDQYARSPIATRSDAQKRSSMSNSPAARLHSLPRVGDPETNHLLSLFQRVLQPPASILIGGVRKWRRLQHYLVEVSAQSDAVLDVLLCVIELLFIDEVSRGRDQDQETCLRGVINRHQSALNTLRTLVNDSSTGPLNQTTHEQHLVVIFLLTWFEVMRDQDGDSAPFPRDLADSIILRDAEWSVSSRALLSWLGTLDSKATHLSGDCRLFSEQVLLVLARHPFQVVTSSAEDHDDDVDEEPLEMGSSSRRAPRSSRELSATSQPAWQSKLSLTNGHMKQILLASLLQPAVEWYMCAQSFCRRIGSHDRHHRSRGTPDDEYAVIMASKQLEHDLWEIWDQRPTMVSLDKEQLLQMLPADLALRLHEVFSVHLACYWILFVYLHRVVWWSLPHSKPTRSALNQVWEHFQESYGEESDGSTIVHPGLLWPVFLFGCECPEEVQRKWSLDQLEALGRSKPTLQAQPPCKDGLPPFRLSAGATRNAQRAARLLRELIKRQEETKARVDDRDLSIEMFGCYFSLV